MTGGTIIFGGSFDPIHNGHLHIARAALGTPGWHRVVFVPTGQNPLKGSAPAASGADRLTMVKRAVAGESRFGVSDIELNRTGPSYTIDTVRSFLGDGSSPVGLLVGDDLLGQMEGWRDADELFRLVHLFVAIRGAAASGPDSAKDTVDLSGRFPEGATFLANERLDVSSSEVRALVRRASHSDQLERFVPLPVAAYIVEHGLYA